jgi:dihydrofolate synthase/folylpolyglutamate synthase
MTAGPEDPDAPLTVLDGAHNPSGAAALRAAVGALLEGRRVLALTAMMRDKRTDDILKERDGFADGVVFTGTSNERRADAEALAGRWRAMRGDGSMVVEDVIPDPAEAYRAARAIAVKGGYGALVVCGSLYLISDIMEAGATGPLPAD